MASNELVREAVRQWPSVVRSLGRSYASSTSTAEREDAASEALHRYHHTLISGKLRSEHRAFSFMRRTAGRILQRQIKRNARTTHLDDFHRDPQTEDKLKSFEAKATLSVILGALKASDREIILMRHRLGLSFDEIGTMRGRTYATVQRQYERAIERAQVIAGVRKPRGGTKRNSKNN